MIEDSNIHTLEQGLSTAEAKELQKKFGRNVIPIKKVNAFTLFLKQFKSAIVILMLIAGAISWSVQDTSGALIILAIIITNTFVGFYQELRAEKKLYDISNLVQPTATVKRDGIFKEILCEDVVVGDILQLTPGTIAAADMELVFAEGLSMNESSITGESFAVEKSMAKDRKIEMGTIVTQGAGEAQVTAIGKDAMLGEIINLAETGRPTNFEKEIRKLTEMCIGIIVITAVVLFFVKLAINPHQAISTEFLIFLLAISIGILPESLPLITTVALSNGAMSLSKAGVVVRNLSAIQDLGSITVLCSDKTGTLTENTLTVSDRLVCDEALFTMILRISKGLEGHSTDPFQQALRGLAKDQTAKGVQLIHTMPFDAEKRSASFIVSVDGKEYTVSQGAHEVIGTKSKTQCHAKQSIDTWIEGKESAGERVLAFTITSAKTEHIVAYISFSDPIRATAQHAVKQAARLGIKVKVISGDSERVTATVAHTLGLIPTTDLVVTGAQWQAANEEQKLQFAKERNAFARFLPVQKYELIRLLQSQDEIVGYIGDGVNDAPSLKLADVGISVSNGTDIAKSSSDIILLKRGLGVIVNGVQHGRSIFENISKYLRETLTENLGNFLSISVLSFFLPYLPMLPIQILFTNLLADFPQLSIATDNVDPSAIRIPRRFHFFLLLRFMLILSLISSGGDMLFFAFFRHFPERIVQSGWFIFSTLTEICTVYSVRSRLYFYQGKGPSKLLAISSVFVIATILFTVYHPFVGQYLKLIPIPFSMLGVIFLIVALYFTVFDVVKKSIYTRWPESY